MSDFDQTLSFNDSGLILSEMLGIPGFAERVAGLSGIILRRCRSGQITRKACIKALDAAVARIVPRRIPKDVPVLQALLKHNNEILPEESKATHSEQENLKAV
jgi:hypothetical protein